MAVEQFGEDVTILGNEYPQGVCGVRNTGAFAADAELVAFLDDDTVADRRWIENFISTYNIDPRADKVDGAVVSFGDGKCFWRSGARHRLAPRWSLRLTHGN